jgi:hypothetical protein
VVVWGDVVLKSEFFGKKTINLHQNKTGKLIASPPKKAKILNNGHRSLLLTSIVNKKS